MMIQYSYLYVVLHLYSNLTVKFLQPGFLFWVHIMISNKLELHSTIIIIIDLATDITYMQFLAAKSRCT